MKKTLALVLALSALPSRAFADDQGTFRVLIYVLPTVAVVSGLTTAIANGVIAGRGRRPHLAWRIAGLVAGALDLGVAAWLMSFSGAGHYNYTVGLGAGLPGALFGGTVISMSIWGWTRPSRDGSVSLAPQLSLTADGRGLSLGLSVGL
jgi:hypothetical protein